MKPARCTQTVEQFFENRLFEGVGRNVLKKIAPQIGVRHIKPGAVIFREGDPADALYLVGAGSVMITKPGGADGAEIQDYVDRGNFFGATALLSREPHAATAVAVKPALIGAVSEETFQQILEIAPSQLHINFLRAVADRIRSANAHFMRETIRAERLRVAGALAGAMLQDLKNPVCIARCCSDLVADESIDPQLRELSKMLSDAVNGILGMTLDLLDYSRGSVPLNKRPVSIWRLLDELNRQSLHLLPARKIGFVKHIRYDGNIGIDLGRMTRVLGNVIENAVRATADGGTLTFTTDLIQDQVVLRISDNGTGIVSEFLPKLFEPFERLNDWQGAGSGLAIGKAIVEAHGGTISIASIYGKGTTVDIRLPKPASE